MQLLEITPNIYQVFLPIVNVFIVGLPEGLTLIDVGPVGSKKAIYSAIRRIGYEVSDIKHVIVTHSHYDHSGSLADILHDVNAKVYMHPYDAMLVRKGIAFRFRSDAKNLLLQLATLGSRIQLPYISIKAVDQIYEVSDGEMIPGGGGLRVIYAPGHCSGQIALLYPAEGGVLFSADAAENENKLGLCSSYQSKRQRLQTIRKLSRFDFKIALFGHGEPILNHASEVFKVTFGVV